MNHTHEELALAAPYVLGALDPADRRAFEAHLASCSLCTDEIRSLSRATDALAHAVPQHTPRPELRARVLAAIADTPRAGGVVVHDRPAIRVRDWLPLAAAILVAAGAGVYAWTLQNRVVTLEARLDDAERRAALADRSLLEARRVSGEAQTALAVLAAPDLTRIDLAGLPPALQARARALWSRNRGMVFTVSNLPAAPAGRVYQVWVVTAQAPVSAGLLMPDPSGGATTFFETPVDIPPPLAIAVTLEPAGGVPAPTGDKYLIGTPL
jgi:anti-sigma-K factor RskA